MNLNNENIFVKDLPDYGCANNTLTYVYKKGAAGSGDGTGSGVD